MTIQCTDHKIHLYFLCGVLGCLLMGGSDWLMIYGNTAYRGKLAWLTLGAAEIPAWRNALAMVLALPAVVLYAVALFSLCHLIKGHSRQKLYCGLTAIGLTPWLCLHLFYVMILFAFGWLTRQGQEAYGVCEAMFGQFSWLVLAAEAIMLLPFLYVFVITLRGKTAFPKWMALNNPLILYVALKGITLVLPDIPARLAFVNGLMSESMLIWFVIYMLYMPRLHKKGEN